MKGHREARHYHAPAPGGACGLPPLSPAALLGGALFVLYVCSAVLSALPARPGAAAAAAAAAEAAHCAALPPPPRNASATRTLYVQPYGGLGNRIRGGASGLALAKEAGADAVIVWREREPGFAGRWGALFAAPALPLGCFPGGALSAARAACRVHRVNARRDWLALQADAWERGADGREVLCLSTMMFLTERQRHIEPFFRSLVPAPAVAAAAAAFQARVGWPDWGQWVGVHVRRADLRLRCVTDECGEGALAAEVLPLDAYSDVLARVAKLAAAPARGARFFVATDDAETEARVRADLGALLAARGPGPASAAAPAVAAMRKARPAAAARDDEAGTAEAAVDLLLLSRCSVLVGTVGSTFSQAAKMWGGPYFLTVGAEHELLREPLSGGGG